MPLDPAIPPAVRPLERTALRFAEIERRVRTIEGNAGGGITGGGGVAASLFDAKGDLLVATADNTPARLAVGANGFMLVGDSSQAVGVRWTNNLSLPDSGSGPRVTAIASQTDTIDVYSNRNNSAPGATTQAIAVVPNTLCTDTADPLSFVQTGIISYANYGDATHAAVGSSHAGTFWMNVAKSGNANSEHAAIAAYLQYSATTTPGRAWLIDSNLHGAIATQQSLLQGLSVFMNNYYNGQPSASEAQAIVVGTKAGTGGGATAAHNAATTYPIGTGIAVMGTTTGGTLRGFETALKIGGSGSGWTFSSRFGTGIEIKDWETNAINVSGTYGAVAGRVAVVVASGAGYLEVGDRIQCIGATDPAFLVGYVGNRLWQVRNSGVVEWGPGGTNVTDSNLYRTGVGILKSDGILNHDAPATRVFHNANQSIANNTTTALAFNSERYDNDTIHDTATNNSRLTCKTAGKYSIKGNIEWASTATGQRSVFVRLNGTTTIGHQGQQAVPLGVIPQEVATDYSLAVNDYVELCVFQNSGGALNVTVQNNYSPEFSMSKVAA